MPGHHHARCPDLYNAPFRQHFRSETRLFHFFVHTNSCLTTLSYMRKFTFAKQEQYLKRALQNPECLLCDHSGVMSNHSERADVLKLCLKAAFACLQAH